ncbi:DEAD/DEAH box helicase [bacterium]|nr:DEAD/DEAH box helicase [bacterium]
MALSHSDAAQAAAAGSVDALAARFAPDYTPEQMENLGVYDSLYRGQSPRLASLGEWKPEWINPVDPKGWAQWYKRYAAGRRIVDEDARQMKRWLSFKARHGQEFIKNPTPRRGWALRNWGIDPANLVSKEQRPVINEMLDAYKNDAMKAYLAARMQPESAAEKQASNAARRLLTKLMKDTAAGNLRWSGRSVSTAENIARTGIFRGGDGDPMFSRHIPLAMYSRVGKGGTALGFTRAAPEYRFRPQNSHYSSKRFFPNTAIGRPSETAHPAKAFFMTEGVKGNMPVPARAGVLRYAVDTGDPKVNALLRNHGARIIPQKLFQHFNDQRIPTSTQLSQSIRQMIGNWSLNANPGAGVFTRNDALRHLATFNVPKSPGVAPSAPSTWLDVVQRWLRGVPNMFKRSAAEQAAKTFYHGTDSKNLKSILARGLDPEFAGTGADSGVPTDIPGYERRVFLATHPQLNSGYGDARLKVELPEYFDVKPLFPWPLSTFMTDHYTTQKIPAKYIKHEKQADLLPDVQLQEHQQRVADKLTTNHPRLLLYHGLGTGKSLSALAAAEAAKKVTGDEYGVVVPASLRDNFKKEINKFTTSNPEIMSYTGLGMGKRFKSQPDTLIVDEAARLRNPEADSSRAITDAAQKAKRVMLLTGTPITNEPKDLASLISILHGQPLSPEIFDKEFLAEEKVYPGWWGWLNGAKPGMKVVMRNGPKLRQLLAGRVDYQPSKTPEGVNVNETIVRAPLTAEQQKIQRAIRTQIAPGFLWKLDKEFPLSKAELSKLNSFLTGLRQISLSTQPFRSDRDPLRAFYQSGKMQTAFDRLKAVLESDPRKKALIYSNFIDAGLQPYAAKLTEAKIPHALFHGGISAKARQAAVDAYNNNKLRALLIGPAGAEGLSTKGTSLIQLLDPHWNEARSQQARGRGLRFDSHVGLPEDLKNVDVERYLSHSEEPSLFGKILGYQRTRTADELLERLTAEKEQLNEQFRDLLKEVGSRGATADR